jgi:hypothetical protein
MSPTKGRMMKLHNLRVFFNMAWNFLSKREVEESIKDLNVEMMNGILDALEANLQHILCVLKTLILSERRDALVEARCFEFPIPSTWLAIYK